MARHPVARARVLERVGVVAVAEHVQERATVLFEPARHASEQRRPVAHVLEHLDGHDSIEASARIEAVHVAGDDVHVRRARRLQRPSRCSRWGLELETASTRQFG